MAKYRNINTIFEAVKKGNMAEDYSSSPRLFSKFEFGKKSQLVMPYLHYIDEKSLGRAVGGYIMSEHSNKEIVQLAKKHNKKLVYAESLGKEIQEIWEKFPKSIVSDMYNIYYNGINKLEFEDRTPSNKLRYSLLEKVSDPVIKVLTNHNSINSMIFTRGMVQYYLSILAMLQQEDDQAFREMMKQLSGTGLNPEEDTVEDDGNSAVSAVGEGVEDIEDKNKSSSNTAGKGNLNKKTTKLLLEDLSKRFSGDQLAAKVIFDQIMKEAREAVESISALMTTEQQQDLWQEMSSSNYRNAEKAFKRTDPKFLASMTMELDKVNMGMSNIKHKIKDLLNNSISYFSSKEEHIHESILEANSIDGLEDWILMHPKLRKVFLNDITIKDTRKIGKINIYIDVSGSMNGSSGNIDKNGKTISKELFSKAFTYKMKQMNILNEVYSFQNSVKREGESLYDILTISGGGGTDLNKVIEHLEKIGKNAIILTDAESYCKLYSKYAFFIGVSGAKFSSFNRDVLEQYTENNQVIVYDGQKIMNVDKEGTIRS